jgi:hypothetical protein
MDVFKALLIRYEKLAQTWSVLQWLALSPRSVENKGLNNFSIF